MFLKNFDFLSLPLTLHYNSCRSHSSIISGILTIITYSFCLLFALYLSKDYLFKINPTSFTYNRVISDVGIFLLNTDSLFHYININNNPNYNLSNYHEIFEIYGLQDVNNNIYINNPYRENYDHYIYAPCINLKLDYKSIHLSDPHYINLFKTGFCINSFYNKTTNKKILITDSNFIPPNLAHGASNQNGTFYGIYIQKCINSTLNNNTCKSQEEIDKFFNVSSGHRLIILNPQIDIVNYKQPFVYSYYSVSSTFSSTGYTINNLNLLPLIIKSHEGHIFSYVKEKLSYIFEQNSKSNVITQLGIRGSYFFWMQNKAIVYERQYKKLENVFADVGGVIKMIIVFGSWINYFFAKFSILSDVNLIIRKYININENYKNKLSTLKLNYFNSNNINSISNNNIISINNKSNISSLNFVNLNNNEQNVNLHNNEQNLILNNNEQNILNKPQYVNLNNSSSKLNLNYIQYKNNAKNYLNRKKNSTIVSTPSRINFRRYRNGEYNIKKKKIIFKNYFCTFCHCYSKRNGEGYYINLIDNYYKKIISEEEMFYLAYEVNSLRQYMNHNIDINNLFIHDNKKTKINKQIDDSTKQEKYHQIVEQISSLFQIN